MKKRLDTIVVERGLANDLVEARAQIMAGEIIVNDQRVDHPGKMIVDEALNVRRRPRRGVFVSRGGEKLAGALTDLNIQLAGTTILDVGASTGGFVDCALKAGAAKVYALDVGTNQLDYSLRNDARVVALEQTDIRAYSPPNGVTFDWILADVSFAGLAGKVLASIARIASAHTQLLLLIKPQFELSADEIPKGGVVEDETKHQHAIAVVTADLLNLGFLVKNCVKSKVVGRSGNQEYFIWAYAKSES
jgi:23S rRNA (cytidine1920-2'-O)/16S rRNA (cytidine1409-2'-O)-methyltransferase